MLRLCWRATIVCLVLAVTLAGCTRTPVTPAHGADSTVAAVRPPEAVLSQFDVPLEYDFTDVIGQVELAVPQTFGSLDSIHQLGDDKRLHYAYVATRGPFIAEARGAFAYLRSTLSYTVRASYKPPIGPTISAGCGSSGVRPQMVIELVAPLTLSPSWHLRSRARVGTLAPATDSSKDHCRMSFLSIDMTGHVADAARAALTSDLSDIDRAVAKVDLTERATGWWTDMSRPIRLTDDLWLLLQPQRFRLKGVTGKHHTFLVQAGLDFYPKIVTGPEPQRASVSLPPLARDTIVNGFRIAIDGNIDYASASRLLTHALLGKQVTTKGHNVTIGSVTATNASGRLALAVAFTGDATGTLRFVGIPRHNAAMHQIVVPDLDYDLKTNNELLKAYSWLHSDALLAQFRTMAQFPAEPILDRGKVLMLAGLNRTIGQLTITATVDSVAVVGLYVLPEGLVIHATGWGKAHAFLRRKGSRAD